MTNTPRALLFDIETKPCKFWAWHTGKQYLNHDQIVDGQKFDIITICYKWSDSSKIYSLTWDRNQNSSKMIEAFSAIVSQADLVIGHNCDKFDMKQINTQRLINNQTPIDWPVSDDTLKQFRKHFALPSYRLDYIAKLLVGAGKDRMQFQDWIDIVDRKSKPALDKMVKYCKKDVLLLDKIYKKLIPFLKPKIHVGLYQGNDKSSCPRCGHTLSQSQGVRITACAAYQRRRCKKCGYSFKGKSV